MLKFEKPIAFFDLETTGTNTNTDRIVQLAITKLFPDGSVETKSMKLNPGIPIPPSATEIHGITDEDVKDAPTFKQISKSLKEKLDDCYIAGFNSDDFDIPLLGCEFDRCDIEFPNEGAVTIDMYTIEKVVNSHKLGPTYKRYSGEELEGAHDAGADTEATRIVFGHQVPRLFELMKESEGFDGVITPESIQAFCRGDKQRFDFAGKAYVKDGEVYWNFSDHKDTLVLEKSNRGFLDWVLSKDFPNETKKKLRVLLQSQINNAQTDLI